MKRGEPEWDRIGIDHVDQLPAIQWKLANVRKMRPEKQDAALNQLLKALTHKSLLSYSVPNRKKIPVDQGYKRMSSQDRNVEQAILEKIRSLPPKSSVNTVYERDK